METGVIHVPEGGLRPGDAPAGLPGSVARILIPAEILRKRVTDLAREIVGVVDREEPLLLLVVLKGAFVFSADLCRALWPFVREGAMPEPLVDFTRVARFGRTIKQRDAPSRPPELSGVPEGIEGSDVLIVEDLVDEGLTLAALRQQLERENARSVRICALLDKRLQEAHRARSRLQVDFTGFSVPDVWVAGYGIDAGEQLRTLPFIVAVREGRFSSDRGR
jgi:hypoxanthine phosphoribosyltransferase